MRQFIADKASRLLDLLYNARWLGPLVVRIVFGYFWLETGIAKVQNLDGFTQRFVGWGVPFPAFSAGLSAWTELLGGLHRIDGVGAGIRGNGCGQRGDPDRRRLGRPLRRQGRVLR